MWHCNKRKLYQRSPETDQFITAKHMGARMSRRIAVDQNVCGGDGGHPGLTV